MPADLVSKDSLSDCYYIVCTVTCRKRYESRFQTEVHSELLGRLCLGNVVVDREIITGRPGNCAAIKGRCYRTSPSG